MKPEIIHPLLDHFANVSKMVDLDLGYPCEVDGIRRYAYYPITQSGDPKKQKIIFVQTYFATQPRRAGLIEQRLLENERVSARKKLSETEKVRSQVTMSKPVIITILRPSAAKVIERYVGKGG